MVSSEDFPDMCVFTELDCIDTPDGTLRTGILNGELIKLTHRDEEAILEFADVRTWLVGGDERD